MALTPVHSAVLPHEALDVLRRHLRVDGFPIVLDLEGSRGSRIRDAVTGVDYLDFYSYFASYPIGYNHPRLHDPDFHARLLPAAITKPANCDIYSVAYAEFVRALEEVGGLPGMEHFFVIDGGALAVENALKVAFDWKVRRNLAAGRGELGHRIIHFRQCFHGRSGYTLSLTDSHDPRKTMYFPKFDWPRVLNPKINFALAEPERTADVVRREAESLAAIHAALAKYPHDIAAVIIEPIQGEGGDNHFRPEFLRTLRTLCDQHEMLLIFDEVQTGFGITGRMWACEHFGLQPDVLCFGKKMQICGLMAGPRVDEVPDNVFQLGSRISSTWGGSLVDMVRATQLLRIVQEEDLVNHAAESGSYLLERLHELAAQHAAVAGVRGRGLMCAFDLPDGEYRKRVIDACFDRKMLILPCGERTLRFRPVLDVETAELDLGIHILDEVLQALSA
ncbi:MAG: L-lysine 6-transaminase [Phycisphaerales bacterium]|nr:L-lysine 6-transaminase [Phycisphaerales bacterium]